MSLTEAGGRSARLVVPTTRTAVGLGCLALVAYFALLPLALLVVKSFKGAGLFDNYALVLSSSANLRAVWWTFAVSAGAAVVALAMGLPLGWLVTATDLPAPRLWRSLFTLPYAIPSFIVALAWTYLASERSGWLNRIAVEHLGLSSALLNVYSATGMILVMGVFFSPLVLMGVAESLARIDPALLEAARLSGASPGRALLDVAWPLVRRSALGGALLAFLATAASYGVPALLGPSAHPPVHVLTTRVKAYIDLHTTRGFNQAIALSAGLFLLAFLFPLASAAMGGSDRGASARPPRPARTRLGPWRWPCFAAVAAVFFGAVALPFLALLVSSFMTNAGLGFSPENLSLIHWKTVLSRSDARTAIVNSLLLAGGAATVALIVAGLIAHGEARSASRFRWVPAALLSIPYATPGTVLAIGSILAFTGGWGLNLFNTAWILLVAYAVKEGALAYRMVREGLAEVHPSMEEAARISGASWGRSIVDVLLPLIRGNLVAAWLLVFMPSFGELTMSVLLFGPQTQTVGTLLFELSSYEDPAAASVLAVIVVVVVIAASLAVRRLSGGRHEGY
ncbi:MAG: iron ABC transporter permease [Candidatus Riflebacteria bacterium]|nr:iron ABC transporter permease [Candidatus Riflebacteria bacterium]